VEVASVDVVDGKIVNPMSHLVRPDRPISPQAMAIHRITESMVVDKPWIEEVIPKLLREPVVRRAQRQFRPSGAPRHAGEWICTMKLARRLYGQALSTAIWRYTNPVS
jgi:exodeoxyribonuclease X